MSTRERIALFIALATPLLTGAAFLLAVGCGSLTIGSAILLTVMLLVLTLHLKQTLGRYSSATAQPPPVPADDQPWQEIFNAVSDPICLIDTSHHITGYNRAFAELIGADNQSALGRPCYALLHGSDQPIAACPHSQTLQDGQAHQTDLYDSKRRLWLRASTSPLFDRNGALSAAVHIVRDITCERQSAETLALAARASEEAIAANNRLLTMMSHELRSPLNGISGMVQLLRDTAPPPLQAEYLDFVEISSENLLGALNDILDFSRIEAGELQLVSQTFAPAELCNGLLRVQRLRAQARGLHFGLTLDDSVPPLLTGDPLRLRQIINNLVTNAIKFTHGGEVAVQLSATGEADDVHLTVRVRDTGSGIPIEAQARIFEPFKEPAPSNTTSYTHRGLGLAICKRLVELMEGTIQVASAPGNGSTFSFTVRLRRAAELAMPADAPPPPQTDQALRVLVAEDQPVNRLFIEQILQRRQYQVLSATNGREALEQWLNQPVDLILMDIQMPEMDGLQALAAIRAREDASRRHTPIIAVTAHAISGDRERLLEAGFDGYIAKPVHIPILFSEMAQVLEAIDQEKRR